MNARCWLGGCSKSWVAYPGVRLNAPTMLKPNGFSLRSSRVVCFSSVPSLSHIQLFATPTTTAHQVSLSITNSQSLLRLMFIESVMPSNHLILCCPRLLLPSIFPSTRVFFQWISSSHQVARVLEFQLQYQSFQWIFRTDFLSDWLVWSPCSPRNSQVSSPTPQFWILESINSSARSFLYGPTLTPIHDYSGNTSWVSTKCQASFLVAGVTKGKTEDSCSELWVDQQVHNGPQCWVRAGV